MNKKGFRKFLCAGLSMLTILTSTTTFLASASAYVSTLDIDANSFCEGAERDYDSSHYYITIRPSRFYDGMDATVNVAVASKKYIGNIFWDYNSYCNTDISMSIVNTNYSKKVGIAGSGTRCYLFDTGATDGFSSNYVAMSSKSS